MEKPASAPAQARVPHASRSDGWGHNPRNIEHNPAPPLEDTTPIQRISAHMPHPLTLCLAFLLTAPTLPAQELPSSLGAVQGTLLAADTKQPILDASVWLQSTRPGPAPATPAGTDYTLSSPDPASQAAVKTDPAGRFLIPKVKPGEYYVLFSAQGYIADRDFVPPTGALATAKPLPAFVQKVTVTPGKTADVSLSLEHGGAIEGTVHFANGQPGYQQASGENPAGLPVALGVRRSSGTVVRVLTPVRTDAQGHFRITDVPAGSYLVFVPSPNTGAQSSAATGASHGKPAVVRGTETTSKIDITLPAAGPKP